MAKKRNRCVWRLPHKLWQRMQPLLPRYQKSPKGGRPRTDLRKVANGIFYVLRTGCQWKAMPREYGSGSTVHRYFQGGFWDLSGRKVLWVVGGTGWVMVERKCGRAFSEQRRVVVKRRAASSLAKTRPSPSFNRVARQQSPTDVEDTAVA